jgi:hypothetical protein
MGELNKFNVGVLRGNGLRCDEGEIGLELAMSWECAGLLDMRLVCY